MSAADLPTTYDPSDHEDAISQRWLDRQAFAAVEDDRDRTYVVMMPLPNVTGSLHMGHAMDNVMQDLLVRWQRMQGANTLWQPGTDHAGIATQAVVERRLKEEEGLTRHDVGRDALVERIWAWKDEYQARIIEQQRGMGCSCDWERQRFTMDAVCSRAVREAFFRLFADNLIFRGPRLVNWDCALQTPVADDELYHASTKGHFYHLRYPINDPQEGEPTHVSVATTRPETMLGDTAVAVHPEPAKALARALRKAKSKLAEAGDKERDAAADEVARIEARQRDMLPGLETLARMAAEGRTVQLPLADRQIPLIADTWAKPELGSGCVKITPAHDPNDYDVWQRHKDIGAIDILASDGSLNDEVPEAYRGLDRYAARDQVIADLQALGLAGDIEDRDIELAHSDRSKTAVEPKLSAQWFVRMEDIDGGVTFGAGTDREFTAAGLAQAAIDAANGQLGSKSGRGVSFYPDSDRYRRTLCAWLAEKRDWCISRQLWWGHQIPVWRTTFDDIADLRSACEALPGAESLCARIADAEGLALAIDTGLALAEAEPERGPFELLVCSRDLGSDEAYAAALESAGLSRDPDVLDTWFSSALWPFSTLGWPSPSDAPIDEGQRSLARSLDSYYPGSCLVTGRDILTLWVARMIIMGLYNLGEVPFDDVFLHAKIMDGKGETMSKSRGNGIDPLEISQRYGTDAMRQVICDMQTGLQDVRLPVMATCPHTGNDVELAEADRGTNEDGTPNMQIYICPCCGQPFSVYGALRDIQPAKAVFSDRFEVGRKFCNKLWNSARFVLMNLPEGQSTTFEPLDPASLEDEDRWILSRLAYSISETHGQLTRYNPSAAQASARDFFWNDLCDWYLELVKPRLRDDERAPLARRVLAYCLDQTLRLFHPFVPFITEAIWQPLGDLAPARGLADQLDTPELLMLSTWPDADALSHLRAPDLERDFERLQTAVSSLLSIRSQNNAKPKDKLPAAIRCQGAAAESLSRLTPHVIEMANLASLEIGPDVATPDRAGAEVQDDLELFLGGVIDPEKERERLTKRRDELDRYIRGSEGKLSNENFVNKAPSNVVEAERARLADLRAQREAIEERLAAVSG